MLLACQLTGVFKNIRVCLHAARQATALRGGGPDEPRAAGDGDGGLARADGGRAQREGSERAGGEAPGGRGGYHQLEAPRGGPGDGCGRRQGPRLL
eukprot:2620534-Alexandrium_andersonii.AAC.1